MGVDCHEDMNVIFHHSSLPNEVKFENERRLFEGEYDLLISNDLVSMSVDVDLDILIMDWSDKLNVNIQRMGRLNRKGKRVTFKNLFIIDDGVYPPFIDRNIAESLLYDLELSNGTSKIITSDLVSEWSDMIELEDYSFDNLVEDVKYAINHDEEILLRDVPLVFRYEEIRTVQKRKKGKKIEAERKLMTVDKRMNSIPWIWDTPCSEEDGEKDLVYIPWLYDVDHPSGENSSTWLITNYDQESGIRTIVPYTGPQYEYYVDVEDDDENDEDEYTSADNFLQEEEWEEYDYIIAQELTYFNVGPGMYSYYHNNNDESYRNKSIKMSLQALNDILKESKEYKHKQLDDKTLKEMTEVIVNQYALNKDYNVHNLLRVLGNKLYMSEDDPDKYDLKIFGSNRAALMITKDEGGEYYLNFNYKWIAIHPSLKEIFIKEFEPIIRKKIGDVDHSKLKVEYELDEDTWDHIPIRFVYEDLTYDIPDLFVQDVWLGAED